MNLMKQKLNKKGFTLAELLVVVAIIAILAAVAFPLFSSQLERSRESTDLANARSASSVAVGAYSMYGGTGTVTFTFGMDKSGNLGIVAVDPATAPSGGTTSGLRDIKSFDAKGKLTESNPKKGADMAQSQKCIKAGELKVTVTDGAVTSNTWQAALGAEASTTSPSAGTSGT